MELIDYPYKELGPRIQAARQKEALVKACSAAAGRLLGQSGIVLKSTREFVNKAFLLNEVTTFDQVVRGLAAGFNAVMLDNCFDRSCFICKFCKISLSMLNVTKS